MEIHILKMGLVYLPCIRVHRIPPNLMCGSFSFRICSLDSSFFENVLNSHWAPVTKDARASLFHPLTWKHSQSKEEGRSINRAGIRRVNNAHSQQGGWRNNHGAGESCRRNDDTKAEVLWDVRVISRRVQYGIGRWQGGMV